MSETVGSVLPGAQVKITGEQEILLKGPARFHGYHKKEEETKEKFDSEGWFHTGDGGYFNESGHLIFLGRLEEMRELKGGYKFAPEHMEGRLKFSPYIKDCIILGSEERDYAAALIQIDFPNVGMWAEKNKLTYSTFTDLAQKPEVYALVRGEVERINKFLPEKSRLRKYINLHKEFDPDEAELTRTRKLRRSFVEKRYKDLIDAMYGDGKEATIESVVKYQDGRTSTIKTSVRIEELEIG